MKITLKEPLRVFVGYDSREDIAYRVARQSILDHCSVNVEVTPIKMEEMRAAGLYWRDVDPLSSTEFSFTRFLTPALAGYKGWAVFCDGDFLFRKDLTEVIFYESGQYAVRVVQHNYRPPEAYKMDNQIQHQYPRKNWSSFMLMNCGHEAMKALSPPIVNTESGAYLHQFKWLPDELIGQLPLTFNYLEGWNQPVDEPDPVAVHFTRGGPWFKDWVDVEYGRDWLEVSKRI